MKLSPAEVDERLVHRQDWKKDGEAIKRQFTFPSFPDAIAFVTRLGFAAEAADHHPELLVNYRRVTVTWTTHSDRGLTEKDFSGAEQSDTIATGLGGA